MASVLSNAAAITLLKVKKLVASAILPTYGSSKAAGLDISSLQHYKIKPRSKELIKTGLAFQLPPGTYGQLASRSGLSLKNSIEVGAGVIDEDYTGEIGVILFNHSDTEFIVKPGDRVAQLIIEKIERPLVVETDFIEPTGRGSHGYGSTGIASGSVAHVTGSVAHDTGSVANAYSKK